ncbi:MAG: PQQ-binding-like beta-propeller repeat protein [Kiritimatiellae bacterium]|jgi:hypothetical protein|nr:PQQ-binding-like beta-propeller repeat protein [Kiritimatiellia bacterium]
MKSLMKVFLLMAVTTGVLAADADTVFGNLDGQILATGAGRVLRLDAQGNVLWSFKGSNVSDIWMLPNGNVLFADNQAKEVDPKTNKIVWSYKSEFGKGGGVFGVQRLENGNTLVCENSTGRILEVDQDGKIVFELQMPFMEKGSHNNLRTCRKLKNGNYLVAFKAKKLVREYTPDGKVVQEIKTSNVAFTAVRLPDGNTVVGHIDGVSEFDRNSKVVWNFNAEDLPDGLKVGYFCGVHCLSNGNIVCGIYSIPVKEERGVALCEVTREKKLVWHYFKKGGDRVMMSALKLSADGKLLPGELWH